MMICILLYLIFLDITRNIPPMEDLLPQLVVEADPCRHSQCFLAQHCHHINKIGQKRSIRLYSIMTDEIWHVKAL
jgi:hypothetical protein